MEDTDVKGAPAKVLKWKDRQDKKRRQRTRLYIHEDGQTSVIIVDTYDGEVVASHVYSTNVRVTRKEDGRLQAEYIKDE